MPDAPELPETTLGLAVVAKIHPGDREALEDTIQRVLCPMDHFNEDGDQPKGHDCRLLLFASTTNEDQEKTIEWTFPSEPLGST